MFHEAQKDTHCIGGRIGIDERSVPAACAGNVRPSRRRAEVGFGRRSERRWGQGLSEGKKEEGDGREDNGRRVDIADHPRTSDDTSGSDGSRSSGSDSRRDRARHPRVAGALDIITRKPLEFRKSFTGQVAVQAVYADLPGKTDPQINALLNWKNEAGTMGVMVQGFYEKRHLRRDGQELLGYDKISPTSALAAAHPDLANVSYPTLIGSALFEQERERTGGMIDVQLKPTNHLTLDFNTFYSHLKASNYNRNWMFWGAHVINQGNGEMPTSYTVANGTLTSPVFPNLRSPGNNHQYAIVDQILRPCAYSETSFYNLHAKYRPTHRLEFTGQLG